ncbi:hypothetical protein EIN_170360, partial [Entamoeba invadens IP1]
ESMDVNKTPSELLSSGLFELMEFTLQKQNVVERMCELWNVARDENISDTSVVKEVINFYRVQLPTREYRTLVGRYEGRLREMSKEYYTQFADLLIQSGPFNFLEKYSDFYTKEIERINTNELSNDVQTILKSELVKVVFSKQDEVLQVMKSLVESANTTSLKPVYVLYLQNKNMEILERLCYETECILNTKTNTFSLDNFQQSIEHLLSAYDSYKVVVNCLAGEAVSHLENVFKKLVASIAVCLGDKDAAIVPSFLAKYLNSLMKRNSTFSIEKQKAFETIDKIIAVTNYVQNSDVFLYATVKSYIERLIFANSNEEYDEYFISKMRGVNHNHCYRLEQVHGEFEYSKQLSSEYSDVTKSTKFSCIVFGAQNEIKDFLNFSPEGQLKTDFEQFNQFYMTKKYKQKLEVCWRRSNGVVQMNGKYQIIALAPQILILMCYMEKVNWSVKELSERFKTTTLYIKMMISGILSKGILISGDNVLKDSSEVQYNDHFASKNRKIGVTLLNKKLVGENESFDDDVKDKEEIIQKRQYLLECSIVRIMKHKKVLETQELIMQTIQMTRKFFQADVRFVKKVIENLIEKEYLMRNIKNIEYVA